MLQIKKFLTVLKIHTAYFDENHYALDQRPQKMLSFVCHIILM